VAVQFAVHRTFVPLKMSQKLDLTFTVPNDCDKNLAKI